MSTAGLLKYVLIYDTGRVLFGVYDSHQLLVHLQNQGKEGYQLFAEYLNKADQASREALQGCPDLFPRRMPSHLNQTSGLLWKPWNVWGVICFRLSIKNGDLLASWTGIR